VQHSGYKQLFASSLLATCLGSLGVLPALVPDAHVALLAEETSPGTAFYTGDFSRYQQPAEPSFSAKMHRWGERVADSLTPKPKVVPADDPVKLSGTPRKLSPEIHIQAAWLAENQGDMANAARQYERALEADPRSFNALVSYARLLDRGGKSDDALGLYQRAQQVAPQQALVWNDMGLLHARRGELMPALAAMNQAVALQPANVRYRNNLAAALVQSQQPQEAVRALEAVHPKAVACQNVGYLLYLHRNPGLAAEYFVQATRLDPSLAAAQQMLAKLRGSAAPRNEPAVSSPAAAPELAAPRLNPPATPVSTTQASAAPTSSERVRRLPAPE
jgi:Tfp pilus assembly protein PilF